MSELPHDLSQGQALTARWLNRLLAFLRSRELRAGPGLDMRRTPSGTTLSLAPGLRPAKPVGEAIPARVSELRNGSYIVRLYQGGTQFAGVARLALTEVSQLAQLPAGAWVLAHPTAMESLPEGRES